MFFLLDLGDHRHCPFAFLLAEREPTPGLSAFWCNLFVIVVGLFLKEGRMKIEHVLDCLEWGTKNALAIGAACAAVGFIVGATTLTGLGLRVASVTIELAMATAGIVDKLDFFSLFTLDSTTLFFLLVYTGIASLILGMGLPTTPNYIVVSIIAAPALLKFGVVPLLSHLFVFYFGILADLTPPVAVAAYAASGISQGDPFKTGVRAFTLAWSGMYVPFAFVFSPVLVFVPWILQKTPRPFPIHGIYLHPRHGHAGYHRSRRDHYRVFRGGPIEAAPARHHGRRPYLLVVA